VVLKSLFEEQIQLERLTLEEDLDSGSELYGEMVSIFPKLQHAGPKEHLMWVKKSKQAVRIPVIGSLNAVSQATWVDYSRQLADQGVDALELNLFATPRDMQETGLRVEEEQLEAMSAVRAAVKVPLSVKLSLFYSNPLSFISNLDKLGVNGLVLFNRFFQPDIDPDKEAVGLPLNFSVQADNRLPQRFAGLLFERVAADVCASTGIMSGKDVARMLLAGASAVQVVTVLYQNGIKSIRSMLDELTAWMKSNSHETIPSFRGKLSAKNVKEPWAYTRAQYAKMLLGPKEFVGQLRG
jgi:dihydroorotate dehydrogenase (fumarate)